MNHTTIKAYAAMQAGGELKTFEFDPGELGPEDVEIDVTHCGICHSDLAMWQNEWDISVFPFVGGHEVAGTVSKAGEHVTHIKVGDRVGLGWSKGYCNTCGDCLGGDHNLCINQQQTIVDNHGGFADKVRAQSTSVIKIPDAFDLADAGPMLCGGVTVFTPFMQYGIKPTDRVGVIGIGGLGHLALQFAKAWGCEVTAFTSESKMDEAKQLGAHNCLNSRDPNAFEKAAGSLDLVLSTVSASMDWDAVLNMLKTKGRLHIVGVLSQPLAINTMPLIVSQCSVSGSPVGSPSTLNTMFEFATRHKIKPVTEHYKLAEINDAFEHLKSGKARYRIVLDNE